jgi:hypothetical protein
MVNILGVDVGMNGALSLYDGNELVVWDMPTHKLNKTKKLDSCKINAIINEFKIDHAWVERVNAFGMGVSSAYNFGFGCGVIEACLSCNGIPFSYVTPQSWKKEMSCPTEKDGARMRASQLLPNFAHNWDLKKHDGRAESALIALYGFNKK